MRSDKQLTNTQLCNSAPTAEVIHHGFAEIFLASTNLDICNDLSSSSGSTPSYSYSLARQDFKFASFSDFKQFTQGLFADGNEFVGIGMKFIPHALVECARTLKTSDPSQLERRIKGRKVAELHRNAIRPAPKPCGECHNRGLAGMKLPERKFVIKIERDKQFIVRPSLANCHCTRLPKWNGRSIRSKK